MRNNTVKKMAMTAMIAALYFALSLPFMTLIFGPVQLRIAEAPGGMLNAVGLQNPGVDAVIAEELPRLKQVFHKPVMANVSGFSIEEYVEVCRKLDACEQVGWK